MVEVISLISIGVSFLSLIISSIVAYIQYENHILSKPNIEVEIHNYRHSFRKKSKEDSKLRIYLHNKTLTIPDEILCFDLDIDIFNRSRNAVGIRGVYAYWKYPLFGKYQEERIEYMLTSDIGRVYGINLDNHRDENREHFVIDGNGYKTLKKHFEVSPYLMFELMENREKYTQDYLKRNKMIQLDDGLVDLEFSKLPSKIILEVVVIDMNLNKTKTEVTFSIF